MRVEFDRIAFAMQWNTGLDEAKLGAATIPFFHVAVRGEVDRVQARVMPGVQEPKGARGRILGGAVRGSVGTGVEVTD